MKDLVSRFNLRTNVFLKNNAIFWILSLIVAGINYLYYPILGRLLHPSDFGEVQTIISIFTQMAVFFQVLGLIGIGIITRYKDDKQRNAIRDEVSRLSLFLSTILLVAVVIFSPGLKTFFHFSSVVPFLVLAGSIVVSVPLAFSNSYLQGHNRFWALSASNLVLAIGRLIFAVVLVLVGFRTLGALGGLVFAQILALIYSLRKGTGIRQFVVSHFRLHKPRLQVIGPELSFVGVVFLTSIMVNLLLSMDILVIKHYFPPRQAGFYTGISIISNIVYYVTAPIAGVLIPSISTRQSATHNKDLLWKSLLLLLLVGGLTTALFVLAPHTIVSLLIGGKFTPYSQYLRGLAIALYLLSITNLLVYYHIGLRHYLIAPLACLGLLATVLLLQMRHATIGAVVGDLELSALFILVLMLGLSLVYDRRPGVQGGLAVKA